MKNLQDKSKSWFQDSSLDDKTYQEYRDRQIKIHNKKQHYKRNISEYQICINNIRDYVKDNSKMLCLGTRNNHERDTIAELLSSKNVEVFSQDIAKEAEPDYICDFNELSQHVPSGWDIMFSNSLDHAIDATETVNDWLKLMNNDGLLVLGFSFDPRNQPRGNIKGDVCVFSKESVELYISDHPNLIKLGTFDTKTVWNYWIIRVTK